jgi:predicted nucleotide-binding protein
MVERGVPEKGLFFSGGGQVITYIPSSDNLNWLTEDQFKLRFKSWRNEVNGRYEVFFGYSSAAKTAALSIVNYLSNGLGVRVREYEMGFQSGGTILEEIEKASQTCLCGIFLFTRDDALVSEQEMSAPRDNVIFEAGYFMKAKGKERTLIIREAGAKMPDDLGGNIYLNLKDKNDTSTIQGSLQKFLENRL